MDRRFSNAARVYRVSLLLTAKRVILREAKNPGIGFSLQGRGPSLRSGGQ